MAQTLDHGVNPMNLGKGDWIYQLGRAEARLGISSTQELVNYEAGLGMQWITVKCADGADTNSWSQFNATLIAQAHAAGLKIFGWAYIYGGTNVPGEINAALSSLDQGADGFIMDAESEYDASGQSTAAQQYCAGIRARYPNTFLAFAPIYDVVNVAQHPNFPATVFGRYCDAAMPQDYWQYYGDTPPQMVADMDTVWTTWQNGLTGTNRQAIKPIIPIGQSASLLGTEVAADITDFVASLKGDKNPASAGGYHGVSFYSCQTRTTNMDLGIATAQFSNPVLPTPPQFKSISMTSGGVVLDLAGQTNGNYAIDISSDLATWTPLFYFTMTSGDYQYLDNFSTNTGQIFYRVRLIYP
ncbi:MAG TPA: hypothetical protein VH413_05450 [Verrucomicrobiae bacterium]|nr:hypothetical protein [Verrucomicrobiae bacterium]